MRSLVIMIVGLLTVAAPAHAQTYSKGALDGHLRLIMEWWPGEYDNHEQIVRKSGVEFLSTYMSRSFAFTLTTLSSTCQSLARTFSMLKSI